MADDNNNDDDYDVGYGKPPKHTQWPKGQSGNPRGRPSGSRGIKTDLHEELNAKRAMTIANKKDGSTRTITGTSQQLVLRALAARAQQGNVAAARVLLDLTLQIFGPDDRGGKKASLSKQDQELLDRLLAQLPDAPSFDDPNVQGEEPGSEEDESDDGEEPGDA